MDCQTECTVAESEFPRGICRILSFRLQHFALRFALRLRILLLRLLLFLVRLPHSTAVISGTFQCLSRSQPRANNECAQKNKNKDSNSFHKPREASSADSINNTPPPIFKDKFRGAPSFSRLCERMG